MIPVDNNTGEKNDQKNFKDEHKNSLQIRYRERRHTIVGIKDWRSSRDLKRPLRSTRRKHVFSESTHNSRKYKKDKVEIDFDSVTSNIELVGEEKVNTPTGFCVFILLFFDFMTLVFLLNVAGSWDI